MNKSLRSAPSKLSGDSYGDGSIIWKALAQKTASYMSTYALLWGAFDFIIIGMLFAALEHEDADKSSVYWWCCVLGCTVCTLNLAYHAWCYGHSWFLPPLALTHAEQQRLLALHDNECTVLSPPKEVESPARSSPLFSDVLQQVLRTPPRAELSATMLDSSAVSWASFGGSPANTVSPLLCQSWHGYSPSFGLATSCQNSSWLANSEASPSLLGATACTNTSWLTSPDVSSTGLGATACTNTSWLSHSSPHLSASVIHNSMHGCTSPVSNSLLGVLERSSNQACESEGVWSNAVTAAAYQQLGDVSATLTKNAYQKATLDPVPVSGDKTSDKTKDLTSAVSSAASKVWIARNISPKKLFQYEENLRIFLCGSVVQPLVKLIDRANAVLADIAPDMQIGVVGVEKLRKACLSSSQLSGVRHISALVPFLERAPAHQHYLVSRLRQLASGGALSSYTWNKGGPGWSEYCPTDAVLMVQLLSFYLDSQLPVDPRESEGRVFSSRHLLNPEDKPPQPLTYPVLHITKLSPPHIKVLLPEEGECEVGEGHKNALHCLLLFLHHLVHSQHCCIAGVNLALTGVNLAWVVADD
ncbi:Cytochrome B561-related [Trinorchestia longiramus]|nr:Cytochrome B561-related [Trinorchestia longiramus]